MRVLKWIGAVVAVLLVVMVGAVFYLKSAVQSRLDKKYEVKVKAIPVPFPLSKAEVAALLKRKANDAAQAAGSDDAETDTVAAGTTTAADRAEPAPQRTVAGINVHAVALQRSLKRGEHYLKSRAPCSSCHGEDLGGKVIFDSFLMGKWIAPNITRGGVTKTYKPEDWARSIRNGVKPDGKPSTMPSQDFTWFSDQEISDIVSYVRSVPAVDRVMPASEIGPMSAYLVVKGDFAIGAETIDHNSPRPKNPPPVSLATEELGKHLANVCTKCHGSELSGGKIVAGNPDWPPARNITFHESGLARYRLEDFQKALREGVRPDGKKINAPMPVAFTTNFYDREIESLYMYLKTVPPKPFPTQ